MLGFPEPRLGLGLDALARSATSALRAPVAPLSPGSPTQGFQGSDPRLTNPRRPHPPFRTRLPYPRFPPVLPSRLVVRS